MSSNISRPVRVLHVVGGMNRGGTETWLMHVLRHIDRERYKFDFLVHTDEPGAYYEEIEKLGAGIIPCVHTSNPLLYARDFKRILNDDGPYDIVHSHVHNFNGLVLRLAHQAGIRVRIAHSHSDTSRLWGEAGLARRLYLSSSTRWIQRHATHGLAAGREAAAALFGDEWERDPRWQVLYCSIDLEPFKNSSEFALSRADFGIPENTIVIGHVGRFVDIKNHSFLIDIAAELKAAGHNTHFLLVGDGPLRGDIESKVHRLGLSGMVTFTGLREDIAGLMRNCMDVFVFPSYFEGLGLALVEAQAAGLPCVAADSVPEEADIVPGLTSKLPLLSGASRWAEEIIVFSSKEAKVTRHQALSIIEHSEFSIQNGVRRLTEFYDEASQACNLEVAKGKGAQ